MTVNITSPSQYIAAVTSDVAVSNGYIYIGVKDLQPQQDPQAVTLVQEDGSTVAWPFGEPIRTSVGGVPIYNSAPVQMQTATDYSIQVLDENGAQVYYIPNSNVGDSAKLADDQTYTGLNTFESDSAAPGTKGVLVTDTANPTLNPAFNTSNGVAETAESGYRVLPESDNTGVALYKSGSNGTVLQRVNNDGTLHADVYIKIAGKDLVGVWTMGGVAIVTVDTVPISRTKILAAGTFSGDVPAPAGWTINETASVYTLTHNLGTLDYTYSFASLGNTLLHNLVPTVVDANTIVYTIREPGGTAKVVDHMINIYTG